jgi:ACS family tartrate transporter-like MFS transporter
VINSIGNLAGFAGPFAMGWIRDQTGSYAGGLLLLAALGIIALGILLMIGQDEVPERTLQPSKRDHRPTRTT